MAISPHETLINGKWKLKVQSSKGAGHYSGWLVDVKRDRKYSWSISGEGPPTFIYQPKESGFFIPGAVKEYIASLSK